MKKFFPASISIFLFLILLFQFGCIGKKTNDAVNAYKFWAGEKPPKEIQVVHGKYWQSSHWSKEYILYLELNASPLWRKEFIKQNNLILSKTEIILPSDAPSWFKPTGNFRVFVREGFSQGSVYYEDPVNGRMFIYEIQL